MIFRKARFLPLFLLILLLLTPLSAPAETVSPAPEAGLLRLHQIDIGCGDAYLLTVDDIVILVDCGTDATNTIAEHIHNPPLFNYLAASGIDHVDFHFVTHWHNDHDYNVDTLSELYGTKATIVYGPSPNLYRELDPLPVGTYQQLKDGDQLTVGPLEILCVSPPYKEDLHGYTNRESVNFIVTYKQHRFMFTGDFMDYTLYRRWGETLKDIDVLSFPHHGLNNPFSVTKEVYKLINPRVVLIPGREKGIVRDFALNQAHVGKNAIYLSARDGNLLVTSDGTNLWAVSGVEPGELPLGDQVPPRE